jgi:hypothetical protein
MVGAPGRSRLFRPIGDGTKSDIGQRSRAPRLVRRGVYGNALWDQGNEPRTC